MARRPRRPFPAPRPSSLPDTAEKTWQQLQTTIRAWAADTDSFHQRMAHTLLTRIPALTSAMPPHDRETLEALTKIALDLRTDLGAVRRLLVLVEHDEADMHAATDVDSDEDRRVEAARRQSVVTLQSLAGTLRGQMRAVLPSRSARRWPS